MVIFRQIIIYMALFVAYLVPGHLMAAAAVAPSDEQQWQIELAEDSSVSIGESDMLTLANASEVIGGMIRFYSNIDQSQQLTADNIKTFGENSNYTIHLDKIQLGDGQIITPKQISFLIQMVRLLASNDASKNEKIERLLARQPDGKSPVGRVHNLSVLLDMANALNIPTLQEFCVAQLKHYLTSWDFLRALAGNNDVLSASGLAQLPAELTEMLKNTISSDLTLLNFIARVRPEVWQLQRTLLSNSIMLYSVAFSPDGRMLASASYDRTIKLWNVADGTLLYTLHGHIDRVNNIAFSPDGTMLASASYDSTVRLWNVANGVLLHTLPGHGVSMNSAVFSPDCTMLASSSHDKTIELLNVADGTLLRTLPGHTDRVLSVAFSHDGTMLASAADDKTIRLWNVANGALLRTLSGHTDGIRSVTFSRDGTMLASASYDKTIRLWNVANGALLRTLPGHTGGGFSVAFSLDGMMLATADANGTIRLWTPVVDLRPLTLEQILLLLAQSRNISGFTPEQWESLQSALDSITSHPEK